MLDMAFLLCILLLTVFASIHCEERTFNITRTLAFYKGDKFIIPSSMCDRTSSQSECQRFHMRAFIIARKCECYCPYDGSTFGFDTGSWSCRENIAFRKQAGCTYKFRSEHDSFPIEVWETLRQQPQFIVSLPSDSCKIDIPSSRYLNCDSSWSTLGLKENSDVFQLLRLPRNDNEPHWDYELKITKNAVLAGRVVKLQLKCNSASKSSCVLFKIAGKISCPVDPTKKPNVSGGQSGASTGTVAVIVIIIILLVIIVTVIVAFIIRKRKRGENVWLMDRISSIATKVRDRPSSKAKEEVQQQEQIYAEITDQPVQPPTHSQSAPEETSTQTRTPLTRTVILLSGRSMLPEESKDDDGYAEPPDSPVYNELEDTNEQSTDNDGGTEKLDSYSQQEGSRGVAGSDVTSSVSVPGSSNVVDKRYAANQRRKPPSPPQKGSDTKERGFNVNDGTDVKGHGEEGNNKYHDYETLRDDNRDVYQPLDRNTMNNR